MTKWLCRWGIHRWGRWIFGYDPTQPVHPVGKHIFAVARACKRCGRRKLFTITLSEIERLFGHSGDDELST